MHFTGHICSGLCKLLGYVGAITFKICNGFLLSKLWIVWCSERGLDTFCIAGNHVSMNNLFIFLNYDSLFLYL